MKATLLLAAVLAVALVGCGDPAPSTKLAPDMPTASSGSTPPVDLAKSKAAEHNAGAPADRGAPAGAPGG